MTTPEKYFTQYRQSIQSLDPHGRSVKASRKSFRYTDHNYDLNSGNYDDVADWEQKAKQDLTSYLTKAANAHQADGKLDATELFWATGIHATFWDAMMDSLNATDVEPKNLAKALIEVDEDHNGKIDYDEKSKLTEVLIDEYEENYLGLDMDESPEDLFERMKNLSETERRKQDTIFGLYINDRDELKAAANKYLTAAAKSGQGSKKKLNVSELQLAFGLSKQGVEYLISCFKVKSDLDLTNIDHALKALIAMDEGKDGFQDGLLFKDSKKHVEELAEAWAKRGGTDEVVIEDDCNSCDSEEARRHNQDGHHHHDHVHGSGRRDGRGRHRGVGKHCHHHHHHHHHPQSEKEKTPLEKLWAVGSFLLQSYAVGKIVTGYGKNAVVHAHPHHHHHHHPQPFTGGHHHLHAHPVGQRPHLRANQHS